ncbi:hypothetical protein VTI74DRAFT_4737 [Chaetomium olivicolor]
MAARSRIDAPYLGWAPENRGPVNMAVVSTLTGLGLLFVAARIYCRAVLRDRLAIEDYIIILSTVLIISNVVLACVAIAYGAGRHLATLPPEDAHRAIFFIVVSSAPGILSFTLPKFAAIILLAKILNPGWWHKVVMWVISIIYFLMSAVTMVLVWVQCTPVAAQWGGAEGTCWNPGTVFPYTVVHGVVGALFDFYLAIYPSVIMMTIVQHKRKKLALSSMLGFGYCAGAIAAYKCYTLSNVFSTQDFTYNMEDIVLWTNGSNAPLSYSIEANCVLIGTCIPCLYPLVKKFFGESALGGSTPDDKEREAIVTIGSPPKDEQRVRRPYSLSGLDHSIDEIDGGNSADCYVALEERPFQSNTAEQWAAEAVAKLSQQQ